ncbi:MAG: Ig-like domain-containing protein, partial [Paludibacteraceae bacterium]|nr:Ig-like domain-containing protein [Paludibacteraceae bacterium]
MKKINFFKLVSLLVVVVFAVACKDNYPESHSVDTLIALDKKDVTLHAGESVNLSAKINFQEDGKNVVTTIEKKVNWATSDTLVAKIDANGVVTAVAGGTAIITAECQGTEETCAVLVKDIFVAGMLIDSLVTIDTFAVIWQKCDTGAFIKYKVPNAEFSTMVVNEQGIYYAGIENGAAKVWKDGAELYSLGEINKTIVSSMCVENGIVYVVGHDTISKENIAARLWKNGESEELELNNDTTFAYDVAVANGNVYVVGKKFREIDGSPLYDALVWNNGDEEILEIPSKLFSGENLIKQSAQAKSICINNDGSIYIGGSVDQEGAIE